MPRNTVPSTKAVLPAVAAASVSAFLKDRTDPRFLIALAGLAALAQLVDAPRKQEWRALAIELGISFLVDQLVTKVTGGGGPAQANGATSGRLGVLATALLPIRKPLPWALSAAAGAIKAPLIEQLSKELLGAPAVAAPPRATKRR